MSHPLCSLRLLLSRHSVPLRPACPTSPTSEAATLKPHTPLPCASDFFHGNHCVSFIFIILTPNNPWNAYLMEFPFRDEARLQLGLGPLRGIVGPRDLGVLEEWDVFSLRIQFSPGLMSYGIIPFLQFSFWYSKSLLNPHLSSYCLKHDFPGSEHTLQTRFTYTMDPQWGQYCPRE